MPPCTNLVKSTSPDNYNPAHRDIILTKIKFIEYLKGLYPLIQFNY